MQVCTINVLYITLFSCWKVDFYFLKVSCQSLACVKGLRTIVIVMVEVQVKVPVTRTSRGYRFKTKPFTIILLAYSTDVAL